MKSADTRESKFILVITGKSTHESCSRSCDSRYDRTSKINIIHRPESREAEISIYIISMRISLTFPKLAKDTNPSFAEWEIDMSLVNSRSSTLIDVKFGAPLGPSPNPDTSIVSVMFVTLGRMKAPLKSEAMPIRPMMVVQLGFVMLVRMSSSEWTTRSWRNVHSTARVTARIELSERFLDG